MNQKTNSRGVTYTRRIHIRKESFKFASAHMTLFEDGTKEPLHGHNYGVELSFEFRPQSSALPLIPFSKLKGPMTDLCKSWDEKVFLPSKSKEFSIRKKSRDETDFILCKKRYVLPTEEIVFLELENITAESLAEELCKTYLKRFSMSFLKNAFSAIQVRVDESPGQGASCTVNFL